MTLGSGADYDRSEVDRLKGRWDCGVVRHTQTCSTDGGIFCQVGIYTWMPQRVNRMTVTGCNEALDSLTFRSNDINNKH